MTVTVATVVCCRRSNGPATATDAARAATTNAVFIVGSCRMDCTVGKNDSVEYDHSWVTEAVKCTDGWGTVSYVRRTRERCVLGNDQGPSVGFRKSFVV